MNLLRIAAGLVFAPFAGLVLFVIFAAVLNPTGDNYGFGFALAVAYVITLALGVPTLLAFNLLKLSRWWQYCLGGAAIGVVGIILVTLQPHDWPRINYEPVQLMSSALLGAASALIFWLVAVFRPRQAHAA